MNEVELVETLSSFALFADLSRPELESVVHTFDEEWFGEGQRILRQGFTGGGFYVILKGEAAVRIDGQERARLSGGDFFGEMAVLLEEPPVAEVVAMTPLHCLVLAGPQLRDWLMEQPWVTFRMLLAEIRRLRAANRWRS